MKSKSSHTPNPFVQKAVKAKIKLTEINHDFNWIKPSTKAELTQIAITARKIAKLFKIQTPPRAVSKNMKRTKSFAQPARSAAAEYAK